MYKKSDLHLYYIMGRVKSRATILGTTKKVDCDAIKVERKC